MHVCIWVCMYVCVPGSGTRGCMCVHECMCVCTFVCMHECIICACVCARKCVAGKVQNNGDQTEGKILSQGQWGTLEVSLLATGHICTY